MKPLKAFSKDGLAFSSPVEALGDMENLTNQKIMIIIDPTNV